MAETPILTGAFSISTIRSQSSDQSYDSQADIAIKSEKYSLSIGANLNYKLRLKLSYMSTLMLKVCVA